MRLLFAALSTVSPKSNTNRTSRRADCRFSIFSRGCKQPNLSSFCLRLQKYAFPRSRTNHRPKKTRPATKHRSFTDHASTYPYAKRARTDRRKAGNAAFRPHAGDGGRLTGNCWNIRRKTIPMIVFTKILIVFPIPILVFRTCWDRDDGMVGDGFAGYDRRFRRIQLAGFRV